MTAVPIQKPSMARNHVIMKMLAGMGQWYAVGGVEGKVGMADAPNTLDCAIMVRGFGG